MLIASSVGNKKKEALAWIKGKVDQMRAAKTPKSQDHESDQGMKHISLDQGMEHTSLDRLLLLLNLS